MNKHYEDCWTALNDLNEKMINNNFILTFIKSTISKHKSGENVSEELNALYVLVRNYFDEIESDFSSVWDTIIRKYPSPFIQEDKDLIMPDDVFEELASEYSPVLPETKTSWSCTVDENGIINLPSELMEKMGFKVGDYLEWIPQDDGESFILKVVNNVSQIVNTQSKEEIKQIIQSIFISGNLTPNLSLELCNDYCEQILEVVNGGRTV